MLRDCSNDGVARWSVEAGSPWMIERLQVCLAPLSRGDGGVAGSCRDYLTKSSKRQRLLCP